MTNVAVTVEEQIPVGATNTGLRIGWVNSAAKAAQNDTWTVTVATTVLLAFVTTDATGALDGVTISTNVITLTSAATGASSGLIIFN